MTLSELYARLDWSGPDEIIRKWEVEHAMAAGSDPSWQKHFRCAIIEEALYGTEEKRRAESIGFLRRLGIWDQIVRILRENQLIGEGQACPGPPSEKRE